MLCPKETGSPLVQVVAGQDAGSVVTAKLSNMGVQAEEKRTQIQTECDRSVIYGLSEVMGLRAGKCLRVVSGDTEPGQATQPVGSKILMTERPGT